MLYFPGHFVTLAYVLIFVIKGRCICVCVSRFGQACTLQNHYTAFQTIFCGDPFSCNPTCGQHVCTLDKCFTGIFAYKYVLSTCDTFYKIIFLYVPALLTEFVKIQMTQQLPFYDRRFIQRKTMITAKRSNSHVTLVISQRTSPGCKLMCLLRPHDNELMNE